MKVTIWSDFVCPFCYIGKRRFEAALNQFSQKDKVEITFKSFELDPNSITNPNSRIDEIISAKYGISLEEAKASNDKIIQQAKTVGLNYDFDNLIPANTFKAHRLSHYAKTHGIMKEMTERLMKAYFVESLNIDDAETLSKLAGEVGLSSKDVLTLLQGDKYKDEVREDEKEASDLGITGVPFFVFNDKYAVSGAQPTDAFLEVLNKIWTEEKSLQNLSSQEPGNNSNDSSDGPKCENGVCEL